MLSSLLFSFLRRRLTTFFTANRNAHTLCKLHTPFPATVHNTILFRYLLFSLSPSVKNKRSFLPRRCQNLPLLFPTPKVRTFMRRKHNVYTTYIYDENTRHNVSSARALNRLQMCQTCKYLHVTLIVYIMYIIETGTFGDKRKSIFRKTQHHTKNPSAL